MTKNALGRVLLWMSGALLSFSAMAVSVRELAPVLNAFEILTIRNAAAVLILLAFVLARPQLRHHLVPRRMHLHALRNVVQFGAQIAWVQSLLLLPMATVFALEFTTPAWVAVLAVLTLGERLTASRVGTIVLGLIGSLVIVRPGLATFQPAVLLVMAAAVGFAVVMVTTKRLTLTDSTFAILFWMNFLQLPLNMAGSDPLFMTRLGMAQLPPALAMAITGLASHYCLTNAFRHGDALIVVPLDFLRVPLIAVVGWLLYAEPLDAPVFVGAALIAAGIIWNLRAEARRRPAEPPEKP